MDWTKIVVGGVLLLLGAEIGIAWLSGWNRRDVIRTHLFLISLGAVVAVILLGLGLVLTGMGK